MARFTLIKRSPEVSITIGILPEGEREEKDLYEKAKRFYSLLKGNVGDLLRKFYFNHDSSAGTYITMKVSSVDEDKVSTEIQRLKDEILPDVKSH
jgi:hypothetical protein